jgi:predicted flap endonuclease-1-like 5' DNA nuclease
VNITSIEGIGPVNANRLREQGITTTEGLLEAAKDAQGRRRLSQKTGLADDLILDWVNRADLMRVPGIGLEYSDLLEQAGVDTVKELRRRNPEHLYTEMDAVNREKHLVRRLPGKTDVHRWVKDAQELPPMVSH